jgi:hypothetical protein
MIAWFVINVIGLSGKVRFFCQDETRIGLKTISGRKITLRGIKPKGKVQWQFKATYIYGIVEPSTGASFFYEFTHLNSECFQVFLDLVSANFQADIIIMQVDQAGAHRAKCLKIPKNIILLFQPAHSPETNPIAHSVAAFQIRVEVETAKRPRPITDVDAGKIRSYDSGSDCFDCWLGLYFGGFICSRYLMIWYKNGVFSLCHKNYPEYCGVLV